MNVTDRFFAALLRHPFIVLTVLAASSLLPLSQCPRLSIVTDLRSLVPIDTVYQTDRDIAAAFGLKEMMIIAVEDPQGIFNGNALHFAERLAKQTASVTGVKAVRSLFSEDDIRITADGLTIDRFLSEVTEQTLAPLRDSLRAFPAIRGILLSTNETCMVLLAELEDGADKKVICDRTGDWLRRNPPPDAMRVHVSGLPVFEGVLGHLVLRDIFLLLPVVSLLVAILLLIAFRSPLLVALCFAEIVFVNIWTMGLMALLGRPLYIMHACLPVILVAVAIADEIHIFAAFRERSLLGQQPREAILGAMNEIWKPVALTSLTTAAGFLSFLATSTRPLWSFGVFCAFGVVAAMVFSLIVTPIGLYLWPPRPQTTRGEKALQTALGRMALFGQRRRRLVALIGLVALAVSIVGLSRVHIQDSWISNFRPSSAVYQSAERINSTLHGTRIIHVEIDSGRPDGIHSARLLRGIRKFQSELPHIPGVGGSFSVADLITKMQGELTGNPGIPDSDDAVAQYMFLLDSVSYRDFWDFEHRKARVTVFCNRGDYRSGTLILATLRELLSSLLPDADFRLGGDFTVIHHWLSTLASDQVRSLLVAFALIFGMASWLFRSARKGAVVSAPIVFAVVLNFGVMGLTGVALSVTTSMVSSVVFGVGIDFAIHLQSKRDHMPPGLEAGQMAVRVFETAGSAIVWDVVVVVTGFLVLVFSSMPPIRKIGLIASLGITTSAVSSLLLVPLLWDKGTGARTPRRPRSTPVHTDGECTGRP